MAFRPIQVIIRQIARLEARMKKSKAAQAPETAQLQSAF